MALLDGVTYGQMGSVRYKMFVSTWNVGGIPPTDDLDLEDWLDTGKSSYDIYVLGFQEIVPLSTRNVLGPEKNQISMKWKSLIGETLNKSLHDRKRIQKCEPLEHHKDGHHKESKAREFRCVVSKQMVGILVSVWVRKDLRNYISNPRVSCIGCGIMGCLRNKGSVSVRFCLHESSFCFVCCHLASGGKEADEMRRNSNVMDILSRTCFSSDASNDLPKKILNHDRIVLFGDLNYRISMPYAETKTLVEQKQWNVLLDKDQLRFELSEGRALEGWNEGVITFSPTYKYLPNSDEYCWHVHGRNGERRRAPAWCDRILWLGEGLKQKRYDRCEVKFSDHRPVRSIFTTEVDALQI
ncbi:unnamed protein product [Musa hybrid cultivar]